MKRILSLVLAGVLCVSAAAGLTACKDNTVTPGGDNATDAPKATDAATPVPTPAGPDIDPSSVDAITETWVATELTFNSTKEYASRADRGDSKKMSMAEQAMVILDVTFTCEDGTSLTIPAFWDGGNVFKVRFAPTKYGVWSYTTKCDTDDSLNGLTGKVGANSYKGNLDIYKHGFVTVKEGNKYFTYDDGTPFFYLGDTHWSMCSEEIDSPGTAGKKAGLPSHFQYIVDKRVSQGFTVYQSEPIGMKFNLTDGLTSADIKYFKETDRYYQYIAEKGLVHANAQFFFASALTKRNIDDPEYLELISRYWVARFGAYPVMWTLAQEIDNDFYNERGDQKIYTFKDNPWVKIAEYNHKYDAYSHPLTGHQENTGMTTVTGKGTRKGGTLTPSGGGISAFFSKEVTEATGHNWWGAQWSPSLNSQGSDAVPKDYWASPKVAINYESRYCYLWTKNFGARAQGWISLLNGFMGCGYGAIDIWLYNSTYDVNTESDDGIEKITPADKRTSWTEAIEFESGYQAGYLRYFMQQIEWWKLVPDFNDKVSFMPSSTETFYTCATIGSDTYVVYFYNKTTSTGKICNMIENAEYNARWFNPRSCDFVDIGTVKATETSQKGTPAYSAPEKPDAEDWVLILTKK